jgi:tryptophan-rich sensory protein
MSVQVSFSVLKSVFPVPKYRTKSSFSVARLLDKHAWAQRMIDRKMLGSMVAVLGIGLVVSGTTMFLFARASDKTSYLLHQYIPWNTV